MARQAAPRRTARCSAAWRARGGRRRRCRGGGSRGAAGLGGADAGRAREHRAGARAPPARPARGGVRDRRRRDREAARARARRDRCRGRDGALRRRRGPPLVRAHDDGEHAAPDRAHRPPAARRRRADHELQHATAERRLEGVPRGLLRECGRREALGAHTGVRLALRAARCRGGRAARRAQRRAGHRRRGGRAARRARGRRPRQLHRLGGDGPLDQRDGRTAAGEGLPRAGREERARGLRRRGSRRRRALGARRPRSRTRASGAPSASRLVVFDAVYEEFRDRLVAGGEGAARRAGDQRGEPRAHPGGRRASRRRRRACALRRRAARGRRLAPRADRARGRAPPTPRSRAPSSSAR